MSFLEWAWLTASLLVRGEFEPNKRPNEGRPLVRGRIITLLVLSVLIIVVAILLGEAQTKGALREMIGLIEKVS
jgi:hypothetical protein